MLLDSFNPRSPQLRNYKSLQVSPNGDSNECEKVPLLRLQSKLMRHPMVVSTKAEWCRYCDYKK